MDLITCGECRRHVRASEQSCPFCSSSLHREKRFVDGPVARISVALGAAGFAASLNACYGAPRGGGGYEPARPSGANGAYVKAVDDENEALVHVEASARAAGCKVSRSENVASVECSFESFSISTGKRKLIVNCQSKVGDECQLAFEKISPKE